LLLANQPLAAGERVAVVCNATRDTCLLPADPSCPNLRLAADPGGHRRDASPEASRLPCCVLHTAETLTAL